MFFENFPKMPRRKYLRIVRRPIQPTMDWNEATASPYTWNRSCDRFDRCRTKYRAKAISNSMNCPNFDREINFFR